MGRVSCITPGARWVEKGGATDGERVGEVEEYIRFMLYLPQGSNYCLFLAIYLSFYKASEDSEKRW